MALISIAAVAKNRVIGRNNQLPWHIPDDVRLFKDITKGHPVIMGRKNYESLGKPLPDRRNIVVSTSMKPLPGIEVYPTIEKAIAAAKEGYDGDIFIIGGATIYEQTMPLIDKMYLSLIKKEYEGDTYFPARSKDEWEIEKEENHPEFVFTVFKRKR